MGWVSKQHLLIFIVIFLPSAAECFFKHRIAKISCVAALSVAGSYGFYKFTEWDENRMVKMYFESIQNNDEKKFSSAMMDAGYRRIVWQITENGESALHLMAEYHRLSMATDFLELTHRQRAKDFQEIVSFTRAQDAATALDIAIRHKDIPMVLLFLKHSVPVSTHQLSHLKEIFLVETHEEVEKFIALLREKESEKRSQLFRNYLEAWLNRLKKRESAITPAEADLIRLVAGKLSSSS